MVIIKSKKTLKSTLKDLGIKPKLKKGKLIIGIGHIDIDLRNFSYLQGDIEFVNDGVLDISNVTYIPDSCKFSNKALKLKKSIFLERPSINHYIIDNSFFDSSVKISPKTFNYCLQKSSYSLFSTFGAYLLNQKVEKK